MIPCLCVAMKINDSEQKLITTIRGLADNHRFDGYRGKKAQMFSQGCSILLSFYVMGLWSKPKNLSYNPDDEERFKLFAATLLEARSLIADPNVQEAVGDTLTALIHAADQYQPGLSACLHPEFDGYRISE